MLTTERIGMAPGRKWRLLARPIVPGGRPIAMLTYKGVWSIAPVEGGFRLMRWPGRYKGRLFATEEDAKRQLKHDLKYRWRGPSRVKRVSAEVFRERMAKKGIEI